MYKINICYQDRTFEHDVYELIKAFYPEAEYHFFYGPAEEHKDLPGDLSDEAAITSEFTNDRIRQSEESQDLYFQIERDSEHYLIRYRIADQQGVRRAPVIGEYLSLTEKQAGLHAVETSDEKKHPDTSAPEITHLQDQASGHTPDIHELRKQNKDSLKYALYQLLVQLTGRTLPWGNLTGIRPAKLVMGLLETGKKNTEIAEELRTQYCVSPQKAALAITIANREREILKDIDYEHGYSLYIGIPFCPSICLYCSFSSYPLKQWQKRVDEYLDALCKEIRAVSGLMKGRKLDTIYIGGGTPTTMEPEQLTRLLQAAGDSFGFGGLKEFTIEAGRPDSITREKLQAIRQFPVTRISVNPQTMNQVTLDIIGRRHTVEQTKEAFFLARECGFDNINMDLIVGLPGEDFSMVSHTLDEIANLDPDSLTVHSLAVKRAARLNMFKDRYQEMTFENNQQIMDHTMSCAYASGMAPYYLYRQKNMKGNFENVGYAKVDKAGIYNILIMEEKQPILALGAGGSSKLVFDHGNRIERVENVKDVTSYIARIDEMIERKRAGIAAWL